MNKINYSMADKLVLNRTSQFANLLVRWARTKSEVFRAQGIMSSPQVETYMHSPCRCSDGALRMIQVYELGIRYPGDSSGEPFQLVFAKEESISHG